MPTIEKRIVRDVVALDEKVSCAEAAKVMADKKIGSIGVSRGGALVGLVTERDLLFSVMARGEAPSKTLGEVLRTDAPAVTPHVTERDCAWLMQAHHTRHLLVKDGEKIVGVISMLDVLQLMLEDNRQLIEQLHTYIRGGRGG
jgi:CBS domain-containing protein